MLDFVNGETRSCSSFDLEVVTIKFNGTSNTKIYSFNGILYKPDVSQFPQVK
jgi:hypothetical protein